MSRNPPPAATVALWAPPGARPMLARFVRAGSEVRDLWLPAHAERGPRSGPSRSARFDSSALRADSLGVSGRWFGTSDPGHCALVHARLRLGEHVAARAGLLERAARVHLRRLVAGDQIRAGDRAARLVL